MYDATEFSWADILQNAKDRIGQQVPLTGDQEKIVHNAIWSALSTAYKRGLTDGQMKRSPK